MGGFLSLAFLAETDGAMPRDHGQDGAEHSQHEDVEERSGSGHDAMMRGVGYDEM
jgi:hypothetical protein